MPPDGTSDGQEQPGSQTRDIDDEGSPMIMAWEEQR